jgi:hypothetical protein
MIAATRDAMRVFLSSVRGNELTSLNADLRFPFAPEPHTSVASARLTKVAAGTSARRPIPLRVLVVVFAALSCIAIVLFPFALGLLARDTAMCDPVVGF